MRVSDLGMGSHGNFLPFQVAWAKAEEDFNQSRTENERNMQLHLSSVLPKDAARVFYSKMESGVWLTTIGIQIMKIDHSKGRHDSLAPRQPKTVKDNARDPCYGPDLPLTRCVVALRSLTLAYCYFAKNLHVRPHYTHPTSQWDKVKTILEEHGVEVITPVSVDGRLVAEEHGVFLHDSTSSFVEEINGDEMLSSLVGEVMNHNSVSDTSRSKHGENYRIRIGFARSQKPGCSYYFKFVKLTEKSKAAIRKVGYALERKAREHYRNSFPNQERTQFVSDHMHDLLGLDRCDWVWEYIDISVTWAGCTERHCDYKNDHRAGYEIAAIHSYPCLWGNKMYRMNLIFTTRCNVGAHMAHMDKKN